MDFYTQIEAVDLTASELFAQPSGFLAVPRDWHVVVSDVKGSTSHVAAGRHQTINLVATGSIIAALNIAHARSTEIPFFFGGDGSTLIVPGEVLDPVITALRAHRHNAAQHFDIDLRVGSVPVAAVYERGAKIGIAKMFRNEAFAIPVVAGLGLGLAEELVKAGDGGDAKPPAEPADLDLTGMECRWDPVKPPSEADEVVCLLVAIRDQDRSAAASATVLQHIETIYGSRRRRNPISTKRLRLKRGITRMATETRAKFGRLDRRYLLENWLRTTIIGPAFFRFAESGRHYVETLPEFSDTLVLDGRINTVISGTARQREALCRELEALEAQGEIVFGLHRSDESIMSCYVRNRDDAHIHFVDGADGGYTRAAVMLKQKLRDAQSGLTGPAAGEQTDSGPEGSRFGV